jgi:hypothetical protein
MASEWEEHCWAATQNIAKKILFSGFRMRMPNVKHKWLGGMVLWYRLPWRCYGSWDRILPGNKVVVFTLRKCFRS